jgi:hypothetical protein
MEGFKTIVLKNGGAYDVALDDGCLKVRAHLSNNWCWLSDEMCVWIANNFQKITRQYPPDFEDAVDIVEED